MDFVPFLDSGLVRFEVRSGDQVLVVLGNDPPCLLVGVDESRRYAGSLHSLDHFVFGVFEFALENRVVWPRWPAVFLDEVCSCFGEDGLHRGGGGDVPGKVAILGLDPGEAFVDAAVLVFSPTAAGAGGVAGDFGAHDLLFVVTTGILPPASGRVANERK